MCWQKYLLLLEKRPLTKQNVLMCYVLFCVLPHDSACKANDDGMKMIVKTIVKRRVIMIHGLYSIYIHAGRHRVCNTEDMDPRTKPLKNRQCKHDSTSGKSHVLLVVSLLGKTKSDIIFDTLPILL